jgi:hypothetical protein
MVILDLDAHALQLDYDLGAQAVVLVLGRDGMIASVTRDEVAVAASATWKDTVKTR